MCSEQQATSLCCYRSYTASKLVRLQTSPSSYVIGCKLSNSKFVQQVLNSISVNMEWIDSWLCNSGSSGGGVAMILTEVMVWYPPPSALPTSSSTSACNNHQRLPESPLWTAWLLCIWPQESLFIELDYNSVHLRNVMACGPPNGI